MLETILFTNSVIAFSGIVLGVAGLILFVDFLHGKRLRSHVHTYALYAAFALTLGSTILALVYSEVFGFIPCGLCWFERIALFSQVAIIGTGIYVKDPLVARPALVLSVFGLVVSLYHHSIQMGGSSLLPCPASGGDCAKRILFEYGFVTFPLLAAITFAALIVLYVYLLRTRD